jgi:hypothetical protein
MEECCDHVIKQPISNMTCFETPFIKSSSQPEMQNIMKALSLASQISPLSPEEHHSLTSRDAKKATFIEDCSET